MAGNQLNLDKVSESNLHAVRSTFAMDFHLFLTSILRRYPSNSDIAKTAEKALHSVRGVTFQIDSIFGRSGRGFPPEDFAKLKNQIKGVYVAIDEVGQRAAQSAEVAAELADVERITGVSLKRLKTVSSELSKKDIAKGRGPSAIGAFREGSPVGAQMITDFGRVLAGPFGPVIEGTGAIFQGLRAVWKAHTEPGLMRNFERAYGPRAGSGGEGFEGFGGSGPSVVPTGGGGGIRPALSTAFASQAGGSRDPLFVFFNRDAYRAAYTREMLRYVKKIANQGVSSSGGGLIQTVEAVAAGGLAGTLASAWAPTLLAIGAVVAPITGALAVLAAASIPLGRVIEGFEHLMGKEYGDLNWKGAGHLGLGKVAEVMGPSIGPRVKVQMPGGRPPATIGAISAGPQLDVFINMIRMGIEEIKSQIKEREVAKEAQTAVVPKTNPAGDSLYNNPDPLLGALNNTSEGGGGW